MGSLLDADHRGKTRFRLSINPDALIKKFEHATPVLPVRLATAKKAAEAGYPAEFLVAPVIAVDGWKKHYQELFSKASSVLKDHKEGLTFEFVSHRFTKRAKAAILDVFSQTELDLDEQSRAFKFGQFGYGKYIYTEELFQEIKTFLTSLTERHFHGARIEYFV
ncbi:MAG: spore photoproduct lyase family protein [Eubacteriales bacterium]